MSKIWFGTQQRVIQVACPAYNAGTSHEGWGASGTLLNGGGWVKSSPTAHMVYDFEWNLTSQEKIRAVADYASGVWGDGPIFFHLPGVAETNALSEAIAAPARGVKFRSNQTVTLVNTPSAFRATHDLPVQGARFVTPVGGVGKSHQVLVPPSHTARLDVWGKVSGTSRLAFGGTTVPLTATDSRVTVSFTNPSGGVAALPSLTIAASGDTTLYGMVVRVVPSTQAAALPTPKWVSGRGHSGSRFEARPQINTYSSALDKYGARARLIETGAWE